MNQQLSQEQREKLEALIVAILLGEEITEAEKLELQQALEQDAGLKEFYQTMEKTIVLVREATAQEIARQEVASPTVKIRSDKNPTEKDNPELPTTLAPHRRKALLKLFKQKKIIPLKKEMQDKGRLAFTIILEIAVVFTILAILSSLFLPSLAKAKAKARNVSKAYEQRLKEYERTYELEERREQVSQVDIKKTQEPSFTQLSAVKSDESLPTGGRIYLPQAQLQRPEETRDSLGLPQNVGQSGAISPVTAQEKQIADTRRAPQQQVNGAFYLRADKDADSYAGVKAGDGIDSSVSRFGRQESTQWQANQALAFGASVPAAQNNLKNKEAEYLYSERNLNQAIADNVTLFADNDESKRRAGNEPEYSTRSRGSEAAGYAINRVDEKAGLAVGGRGGVAGGMGGGAGGVSSDVAGGMVGAGTAGRKMARDLSVNAPGQAPAKPESAPSFTPPPSSPSATTAGRPLAAPQAPAPSKPATATGVALGDTPAAGTTFKTKDSLSTTESAKMPAEGKEVLARRASSKAEAAKSGLETADKKPAEKLQEKLAIFELEDVVEKPKLVAPLIHLPEISTAQNRFSTFSLNISDVSFKLAQVSLQNNQLPDPNSVRVEEFVNAFNYNDPAPASGSRIGFNWERARYPFAHNRDIVRFSVKAGALGRELGRPLNLVILLDNSGSMERADRVAILQEALKVLANLLKPQDKISVVAFARTARLIEDGMPGGNPKEFLSRVLGLNPQGGTNLEDAMDLGYKTALRHFIPGGVNRVILLTDGAANLGDVDPNSLKQKVIAHRQKGVALDCFGVGWEGYNDELLEILSRNGDGRYGFMNEPEQAPIEFAHQLAGALTVLASDVKVQVEFNPARVITYRQIGYAKHQLTKEQFRDNTVDAGEIAAAESGNALYLIEVNPQGTGNIGVFRVRYKIPESGQVVEQEWTLEYQPYVVSLEQASPSLRLAAVAGAFGEWLSRNPYAGQIELRALERLMTGLPEFFAPDNRPAQLLTMIRQARQITGK